MADQKRRRLALSIACSGPNDQHRNYQERFPAASKHRPPVLQLISSLLAYHPQPETTEYFAPGIGRISWCRASIPVHTAVNDLAPLSLSVVRSWDAQLRACPFQSPHNSRVTHVVVVGDCAQAQSLNVDHAGHLAVLIRGEFWLGTELDLSLFRCGPSSIGAGRIRLARLRPALRGMPRLSCSSGRLIASSLFGVGSTEARNRIGVGGALGIT